MPNATWGLIGVIIGGILVFASDYVLKRQTRKWQIEDEQRKVRQEPLKQSRQQTQNMMSLVSKCLVSGISMSEIPRDHFGNLFLTIEYLYQKNVLDENKALELGERLRQAWKQQNSGVIIEIGSEVRAWIDEAIDATFQRVHETSKTA